MALENKEIDLHAIVDFRYKDQWIKETTVGRILLNEIMPDEIGYYKFPYFEEENTENCRR